RRRAISWRGRGARQFPWTLRQRNRQLVADHEKAEAIGLFHPVLYAVGHHLSIPGGGTALFFWSDSAGWTHADQFRVRQRARIAFMVYRGLPGFRRMESHRRPSNRLRRPVGESP